MSTRMAGVIGWPIEHSKSPLLHGYWLDELNIDGDYTKVAAAPGDFEATVRNLMADGWRGANVTIPHKEAALAMADEVSDTAKAIGAANTLIFTEDGKIHADNTDGFGFVENLIDRGGQKWLPQEPATIFGAGGASRAIIYALLQAGAPEIRLTNRTKSRADTLAGVFGTNVRVVDWNDKTAAIDGAGLIVNTTSLGMKDQAPLEVDFAQAPQYALATDIVYIPLETPFLKSAAKAGLATVDGLGMLIHQGRPGFEAWFGKAPIADAKLRELLLAA
ncbi:MAG: shikimate dehydrogenase [Paracoccaceae bacterium]|nr:shikimate dehydrogenase [Paracoccaceae bacterium]MDG1369205.1 shikimate dehydrogenase [Paracoccaceae bacterium]